MDGKCLEDEVKPIKLPEARENVRDHAVIGLIFVPD